MAKVTVNLSDNMSNFVTKFNELSNNVGDLTDLNFSADSDLTQAINYVHSLIDSDIDFRSKVSVTDTGGDGSLNYNSTSGVITYTGPNATEVRAHFAAGTNTTYSAGSFSISDSTIRGKVSVTDTGGDGSLGYNSGTGVITYTGPNATEVRAHLSAGTGVTYSTGQFSIGQPVATSNSVTFANVTTPGNLVSNNITTTSNTHIDVKPNNQVKWRFGEDGQIGIGGSNYGNSGQVITSSGSGGAPTWETPAAALDLVKGTIVFNGSTGAVIRATNLTLSKVGTGNYNITCDASIRDGGISSWGVVITNVDDGVLSKAQITTSNTVSQYNTVVTTNTSTGFTVRAKQTFNSVEHFGGNDNNLANVFGITSVDPTYISLVVF